MILLILYFTSLQIILNWFIIQTINEDQDLYNYSIYIAKLQDKSWDQPYNDIEQQFSLFSLKQITTSDIAIISKDCLIDNLPTDRNISYFEYLQLYPQECLNQNIYIYYFTQEQFRIVLQEILYNDKCLNQNSESMKIVGVQLKTNKYCQVEEIKTCQWQLSQNFLCNQFGISKYSIQLAITGDFQDRIQNITKNLVNFNQNKYQKLNITFRNVLQKSFQQHRDVKFQQTNSGRKQYKLNNNYLLIILLIIGLSSVRIYWSYFLKKDDNEQQYDYYIETDIKTRRQILFSILN